MLMLSLGVATRWQCFRMLLCLEVRCENVAEGHGWQVGSSDAVFIIKKGSKQRLGRWIGKKTV